MKLLQTDFESAVWNRLTATLDEEIDRMRKQNDGDLTHDQTIALRARIAYAKYIRGLGSNEPQDDGSVPYDA